MGRWRRCRALYREYERHWFPFYMPGVVVHSSTSASLRDQERSRRDSRQRVAMGLALERLEAWIGNQARPIRAVGGSRGVMDGQLYVSAFVHALFSRDASADNSPLRRVTLHR